MKHNIVPSWVSFHFAFWILLTVTGARPAAPPAIVIYRYLICSRDNISGWCLVCSYFSIRLCSSSTISSETEAEHVKKVTTPNVVTGLHAAFCWPCLLTCLWHWLWQTRGGGQKRQICLPAIGKESIAYFEQILLRLKPRKCEPSQLRAVEQNERANQSQEGSWMFVHKLCPSMLLDWIQANRNKSRTSWGGE